jgi:hypothetical protein
VGEPKEGAAEHMPYRLGCASRLDDPHGSDCPQAISSSYEISVFVYTHRESAMDAMFFYSALLLRCLRCGGCLGSPRMV